MSVLIRGPGARGPEARRLSHCKTSARREVRGSHAVARWLSYFAVLQSNACIGDEKKRENKKQMATGETCPRKTNLIQRCDETAQAYSLAPERTAAAYGDLNAQRIRRSLFPR